MHFSVYAPNCAVVCSEAYSFYDEVENVSSVVRRRAARDFKSSRATSRTFFKCSKKKWFIKVDECGVDNKKESAENAIKSFHSGALQSRYFMSEVNNGTFLLVDEFSAAIFRQNSSTVARETLK